MSYQLSAGESRRGWIVVGATFVTLGMVYGVWYSYSVFLVAFVLEFGWSRSLVAGVFSTFVIVHGVLGPVNGWLAGRIGPRWIILTGGGLLGVGLLLVAETHASWHLYATFGGIVALGVACAGWVPSIILVRVLVSRSRGHGARRGLRGYRNRYHRHRPALADPRGFVGMAVGVPDSRRPRHGLDHPCHALADP